MIFELIVISLSHLYLQSPMVNETSLHREIMSPLCLAIVAIPEESKKLLVRWWTKYVIPHFERTRL